jgi:hypothetical protein
MFTSDFTHGWWGERVTYRNQRWVTDDAPPPSSEPEPDVNDISDQPEEISSDQTVNIDYANDDDMMQSVDCNTDNDVYQADNDEPNMHPLPNNVLNASELYSIVTSDKPTLIGIPGFKVVAELRFFIWLLTLNICRIV